VGAVGKWAMDGRAGGLAQNCGASQSLGLSLCCAVDRGHCVGGVTEIIQAPPVGYGLSRRLPGGTPHCGAFLFRDELEKHFRETDPRGIELNGFMTFFFNFIYFQYWFHQVYLEQHEVDLRLT